MNDWHKITDWENNHDVQQQIRRDLDGLFQEVEQVTGIEIEPDEMNLMIDRVLEVAKARSRKGQRRDKGFLEGYRHRARH